jgi:hypothetical protein
MYKLRPREGTGLPKDIHTVSDRAMTEAGQATPLVTSGKNRTEILPAL